MLNKNDLQKYKEFDPINSDAVSQSKHIIDIFRQKMIDIAFISNESNSLHIDDTHPIHTKIAQHLQLEALYDDHFKEYHQRKFQIENNAMFVDTMDSEELKSLKQSKTLYHDSVIKHTLDIANVIERDKELKTIIHSAIHNTESIAQHLNQKWIDLLDSINVFHRIVLDSFDYNAKYQTFESKRLHQLKTMIAVEQRTLNYFTSKQKTEREERKCKLQRLYERLSSLQNKIIQIKNDTQRNRDTQQKDHKDWIDQNIKTWTTQNKQMDKTKASLSNKLNEMKDKDTLKEHTLHRRVIVKKLELEKLENEYTLSIQ
eukprot:777551_1